MLKYSFLTITCLLFLVGCGTETNTGVSTPANENMTTTVNTSSTNTITEKYTLEMVAAHNTSSDCWSIINGKVYNLTEWIELHPGGNAQILRGCGKDISSASTNHPGGAFDGTDIQDIIKEYYIGDLE